PSVGPIGMATRNSKRLRAHRGNEHRGPYRTVHPDSGSSAEQFALKINRTGVEQRNKNFQVLAQITDWPVERLTPFRQDDRTMRQPDAQDQAASDRLVRHERLRGKRHRMT